MFKEEYQKFLVQIKGRIQTAQTIAVLSVNAELIYLYWDIGRMIEKRQKTEGWGAGIIPNLSKDIRNELPEIKGFSERNLKRMIRLFREYPDLGAIRPRFVAQMGDSLKSVAKIDNSKKVPQPVAQLKGNNINFKMQQIVVRLPWGHNILLIEKVKDIPVRLWYMQKAIENGWSRNVLGVMVDSNAHQREGKAVTNFDKRLPSPQSDLAKQSLKDPYIFDFLTMGESFRERELETELVRHLEKFLLELGQGFAFVADSTI